MTSYRLILCLIISLSSFGCDPGSASQTGQVRIPTSEASQRTSESSLGSNSLHQPFQTNAIRHAARTANANSPSNYKYLESIASGENKSKSKKDLFWIALIIFSTILGAAIFAGLFYLVTNSSVENEHDESTNADSADEEKSASEINPHGLNYDLNSAHDITDNSENIAAQTTTGNHHEESELTAEPMEQNSAESSLHNLPHNLSAIDNNSAENSQPKSEPKTPKNQPDIHPNKLTKKPKFLKKFFGRKSPDSPRQPPNTLPLDGSSNHQNQSANQPDNHGQHPSEQPLPNLQENRASFPQENVEITAATDKGSSSLAIDETTRLAKIDIIEELIKELQNPDPVKRRKSIWQLSQQGDSRAVQPLVDLIIDSDSKQISLILGALSEIGTRTLKPMNRALALSLQDRNPDVRKNAIRDLTRIYDLINQITQLLTHAVDDADPEVQETARWALSQLSQLSKTSGYQSPSTLHPSISPGDNYREELPD